MTNTDQSKRKTVVVPFSALRQHPSSDANSELLLDQLGDSTNDTINESSPPSVLGEQSVSGDMPDPEADDDTLLNAQQVGLQTDSDYDDPKELNLAEDVEEAEKLHRSS